jgi:hypothetical protein
LELPPSQADAKGKTFGSTVTANPHESEKPKQVEEPQQPQKT